MFGLSHSMLPICSCSNSPLESDTASPRRTLRSKGRVKAHWSLLLPPSGFCTWSLLTDCSELDLSKPQICRTCWWLDLPCFDGERSKFGGLHAVTEGLRTLLLPLSTQLCPLCSRSCRDRWAGCARSQFTALYTPIPCVSSQGKCCQARLQCKVLQQWMSHTAKSWGVRTASAVSEQPTAAPDSPP